MPETRYTKVYDGQGNLIVEEPYEVSDEQLHRETEDSRIAELLAMGHSAVPVPLLTELVFLLAKRLGCG